MASTACYEAQNWSAPVCLSSMLAGFVCCLRLDIIFDSVHAENINKELGWSELLLRQPSPPLPIKSRSCLIENVMFSRLAANMFCSLIDDLLALAL